MTKNIAIMVCGILAVGIFGGFVGDLIAPDGPGTMMGFVGGALGFVCARLWLGERKNLN